MSYVQLGSHLKLSDIEKLNGRPGSVRGAECSGPWETVVIIHAGHDDEREEMSDDQHQGEIHNVTLADFLLFFFLLDRRCREREADGHHRHR